MKTTIDIADPLLVRAKRLARKRNTTLKQVIEESLRMTLERERRPRGPVELDVHTFRGQGLQPGLSWDDFGAALDLTYEGRGS
jgi:predicted transcriptional regulator